MKSRDEALGIARRMRSALAQTYGDRLKGVYLYGSVSRNEQTDASDIDIAVVLDEVESIPRELSRTSRIATDICLETDGLISLLFISEADYFGGRRAIDRAVRREGVAL